MTPVFLLSFVVGLLLAVRMMFFGAERRLPAPGALPLRRWEPALLGFLVAFGAAGYLLERRGHVDLRSFALAAAAGVLFSFVATRGAVATARLQPEHDPEDPRYVLQGRVATVTVDIPAGGEGEIRYEDVGRMVTIAARDIGGGAIAATQEVCIERVEDGVAHVELWALVEERL